MTVLGVDPGIATTGYGLVREETSGLACVAYGVITTPPGVPLPERLQTIYRELTRLVREYEPASAAVEQLFFGKSASTAMSVGQARGVALLALADCGLPVSEYKPAEIKQAVAGYGGAGKPQIQEMVRVLLGLAEAPRPDDAADALAIAVCHLHGQRFRDLVEQES